MKKANIISGIIGMGFSSAAFIVTLGFKKFRNVPVGPEFFPRWLAVGLFICSAVLIIQSKSAGNKPAPTLSIFDKGIQRILIGAVIIVVYSICWTFLGFLIATPPAVFGLMFLLGLRRYPLMIIFSLMSMIIIFCTFRYLLGIDMPLGFLDGLL